MTTNNAPLIFIRPSAAVTFCKPKIEERAEIQEHIDEFLKRKGKITVLEGFKSVPRLNSTPKPLHVYCDTSPVQSLRNINKSKNRNHEPKRPKGLVPFWKIAYLLGHKSKGRYTAWRTELELGIESGKYPKPDRIEKGHKGSYRMYYTESVVTSVFGVSNFEEI